MRYYTKELIWGTAEGNTPLCRGGGDCSTKPTENHHSFEHDLRETRHHISGTDLRKSRGHYTVHWELIWRQQEKSHSIPGTGLRNSGGYYTVPWELIRGDNKRNHTVSRELV
jgi:hypothetical protein